MQGCLTFTESQKCHILVLQNECMQDSVSQTVTVEEYVFQCLCMCSTFFCATPVMHSTRLCCYNLNILSINKNIYCVLRNIVIFFFFKSTLKQLMNTMILFTVHVQFRDDVIDFNQLKQKKFKCVHLTYKKGTATLFLQAISCSQTIQSALNKISKETF